MVQGDLGVFTKFNVVEKQTVHCGILFCLKFLIREKTNLNLISHNSAIGLIRQVLNAGIFITQVCYQYLAMYIIMRFSYFLRFPYVRQTN